MINPYKSYSKNQLDNDAPGDQVAALFDKAAEHISNAAKAIAENDVQARFEYSQKTMAIMEGLLASLNRDTPETAEAAISLEAYYRSMIMMIGRVNVYNDSHMCYSLEKGFRSMAEFWREASRVLAAQQNEMVSHVSQPSSIMA